MRAIGIILAGGNNKRMRELSNKRAISAMPVAGTFRSIDFSLSNMSNSHIQKVAVLTQYNSRSLNQHLSSSKWWDFGRKQGGLYVFTPTITAEHGDWFRGVRQMHSIKTLFFYSHLMSLMSSLPQEMGYISLTITRYWNIISKRKRTSPLYARTWMQGMIYPALAVLR